MTIPSDEAAEAAEEFDYWLSAFGGGKKKMRPKAERDSATVNYQRSIADYAFPRLSGDYQKAAEQKSTAANVVGLANEDKVRVNSPRKGVYHGVVSGYFPATGTANITRVQLKDDGNHIKTDDHEIVHVSNLTRLSKFPDGSEQLKSLGKSIASTFLRHPEEWSDDGV